MDRQKKESTAAPLRPAVRTGTSSVDGEGPFSALLEKRLGRTSAPASTQVKIVEFRSGEAVVRHPDLKNMLRDGWHIESAVPHVVDMEDVRLLVVMTR